MGVKPTVRWDDATASDRLTIYVSDHVARSRAVVGLARRCRDRHVDRPWGSTMARISTEIEEDVQYLEALTAALDITPSSLKQALAVVLERGGRWKFNGQVVGESELSHLVELEALVAAVASKRGLWRSLQAVLAGEPLSDITFEELVERADGQLATLEDLRPTVAAAALT